MDWILIVGVIVAALVGLVLSVEDEGNRTKRKALPENKKRDEKLTPIKFKEAYKKHLKRKPKNTNTFSYERWKEEDILWSSLHSHLRFIPKRFQATYMKMADVNVPLAESQAAIFARRYKPSVKDIKTKTKDIKTKTKPLIDVKEYWNKNK